MVHRYTYIYTIKDGWTYRASVIDLYSKKIIGYAYGTSMTTELAIKAVENACLNVKDTKGIILHSDLGTQYTSIKFEDYLASKGIVYSFSSKGNPYDNACIESFHSILKRKRLIITNIVISMALEEQSLNILNLGTTEKGFIVLLII